MKHGHVFPPQLGPLTGSKCTCLATKWTNHRCCSLRQRDVLHFCGDVRQATALGTQLRHTYVVDYVS